MLPNDINNVNAQRDALYVKLFNECDNKDTFIDRFVEECPYKDNFYHSSVYDNTELPELMSHSKTVMCRDDVNDSSLFGPESFALRTYSLHTSAYICSSFHNFNGAEVNYPMSYKGYDLITSAYLRHLSSNFTSFCEKVAKDDSYLKYVLDRKGKYPFRNMFYVNRLFTSVMGYETVLYTYNTWLNSDKKMSTATFANFIRKMLYLSPIVVPVHGPGKSEHSVTIVGLKDGKFVVFDPMLYLQNEHFYVVKGNSSFVGNDVVIWKKTSDKNYRSTLMFVKPMCLIKRAVANSDYSKVEALNILQWYFQ